MINLLRIMQDILKKIERTKVEILIRKIAKEEGLDKQARELAVAVARCESGLNSKATNRTGNNPATSTDRGLYMWNDYWHQEISDKCAFNPECATRAFCKAFKEGHLNWWSASRRCWEKYR